MYAVGGFCLYGIRPAVACILLLSVLSAASCAGRRGVLQPSVSVPVTSGFGPFNLKAFQQYDTVAVYTFLDAPSAPGSGQAVTTALISLLDPMGFQVISQIRLDRIAETQLGINPEELRDESSLLKIARLSQAQAMILGEVGRWETMRQQGPIVWVPLTPGTTRLPRKQWEESNVAVSLKIIDVRTGDTLFTGQGTLSEPTQEPPIIGAQQILAEVLARCFQHVAPLRTGLLGYKVVMQESKGIRVATVTEVVPGSPVQRAGLQVGDVILACNDSAQARWRTIWHHYNTCAAEAGQTRSLQLARADQRMTIRATALARSSFFKEPLSGDGPRDPFAPL
jgi:curli biogenesis system outer membrane secretion channel CsgG